MIVWQRATIEPDKSSPSRPLVDTSKGEPNNHLASQRAVMKGRGPGSNLGSGPNAEPSAENRHSLSNTVD
jgi:hypothetical protein